MRKWALAISILFVAIFIVVIVFHNGGKRLLKDLNSSDVTLIQALHLPPNETKIIDKKTDIEDIVNKLKNIVTYEKVDQNDYNGQVTVYTLLMKDGSKREIMISNPIVKIDGQFYKSRQ